MNANAANQSLSWFKKYYADEALDLTPKFQRRPVWSELQASYLIDSILNELPVPEVFVRSKTSSSGDSLLEVVDGQQRLRSIIRFFTGDLTLEGDDVSEGWRGFTWSRLTEEQQQSFWNFKLVVRELKATDAEVRDIFRRLNANQSSLNDQELRHSQFSGLFIKCVETLAADEWWLLNRLVTPEQIRRMLDVEFISELLIGLMSGPLDKKEGLDGFYSDYDGQFVDQEGWVEKFKATRALTEAVAGEGLAGWRSKTEYYSLFLACGRLVVDEEIPKGLRLVSARKRLAIFRGRADKAKRKDNRTPVPQYVSDYADAVARASTDLGRRLHRVAVVEALLRGQAPPTGSAIAKQS